MTCWLLLYGALVRLDSGGGAALTLGRQQSEERICVEVIARLHRVPQEPLQDKMPLPASL